MLVRVGTRLEQSIGAQKVRERCVDLVARPLLRLPGDGLGQPFLMGGQCCLELASATLDRYAESQQLRGQSNHKTYARLPLPHQHTKRGHRLCKSPLAYEVEPAPAVLGRQACARRLHVGSRYPRAITDELRELLEEAPEEVPRKRKRKRNS